MIHLQPYQSVTIRGRPALILWLWPCRTVARVRYLDIEERGNAMVSEITEGDALNKASP